jgi:ADP-heptose:LPS heptosyltransferase
MTILHVRAGGGVGDFIYTYFKKPQWKLVENVKKHDKDIKIIAIITCHSSTARELIELNPHIDAILTHDWKPPGHPDERMWKQMVLTEDIKKYASNNQIKPSLNKLYLSPTETKILDEIRQEPYVVIHPFAGLPHRGCRPHPKDGKYKCFPDFKYIEVIEELQRLGTPVVILGHSERGRMGIRCQDEVLDVSGPKIHNMINLTSLRLGAAIVREAAGFIGAHSSMLSAAWTNSVPSVYFYPTRDEHGNQRSVMQHGGETGNWAYEEKWTHAYELPPHKFQELETAEVVKKLQDLMGQ